MSQADVHKAMSEYLSTHTRQQKEEKPNLRLFDALREIIPALSQEEKAQLKASIESDGVNYPVMVLPDGRIVDGMNRWELSGGKVATKVVALPEREAILKGVELNFTRRHLSGEQRKEIISKLRKLGYTQEEVGHALGVARNTVSDNENIVGSDIAFTPPDLRVQISES